MSGAKGKGGTGESGIKIITENRKARASYSVDEKVEVSIMLRSSSGKGSTGLNQADPSSFRQLPQSPLV